VILVFVVNRCREEQKRAEYEDYMEAVARVSSQSEQVGRNLNKLISSDNPSRTPEMVKEVELAGDELEAYFLDLIEQRMTVREGST
jgi:hypothetical protein